MSRILIAGCGYVGAAAADLFHGAGWEVEGWTGSAQSAERLSLAPYLVRAVDLTDKNAVRAASVSFDAIIQAASSRGGDAEAYGRIYLEAARNLSAAFPDSLLLFTSSTSVYAQTAGEWVSEVCPAEPERQTGRVLREAEEFVLGRGGIVARLAGIYGPGRSALLKKFLAGEAVLDPSSERFINQVHRDDVATALLLLVQWHLGQQVKTRGRESRIFNLADNHPLSQRDAYAWLAAHLQRPLPPVADVAMERKRGNSNKRVSSEKLQALGWSPLYPTFQGAMAQSILPSFDL